MNHDRKREKSSDAKLAEQKAKFASYKNLTDKALTKVYLYKLFNLLF